MATVNSDGSFSTSIKIDIPQGTNKMQPDLQMSYNGKVISDAGHTIDQITDAVKKAVTKFFRGLFGW